MPTSQTKFQTLMPIKTKGALPPLFCVHGEPLKMAMRIKADRPVYGLSHVYHASFQDTVADSIEELARQYLDDIYKVWPTGPYYLLGFSAGAMVAYEMARQLLADGRSVKSLVMIEPPLGRQAAALGNKSDYVKNYLSESGWNLTTAGYLLKRVIQSLASRTNTLISRIKVVVLLKLGKDVPEDLRWLGYLSALGPAIGKYEYHPISCPATLFYRELSEDAQGLVNELWTGLTGPTTDIRYAAGASGHGDFMLDPHLNNVSQLLDAQVTGGS